ncbi:FHA domain-containing protein PS1-like [Salvia divinorum]|uniref:FHA domain-containing protein PS1-like n=1 Tax=Salvia divinorum TaxID=28513 RepID=A0ABD1FQI2_SALDI
MAKNQEQVETKEREIPVFAVLKNDSILKNIFVLDNPPPNSSSSSGEISGQKSEIEEVLLVGRHPDCNIKLEHPSISRFHLRIHSKPSSRSLFVTDLSSIHGTCISGNRIEPGVAMELLPGDMLKLGESSRLYRLDWVPISFAYEVNGPFVPQLDALDIADEDTLGADQDENHLSRENERGRDLSDEIEAIKWQFSEDDLGSSVQETAAEVENTRSPEMFNNENEASEMFNDENEASGMFNDENEASEMFNDENEISSSQLLSLGASFSGDEEAEEDDEGNDLGETMEDRTLCDEATTPPRPEDEAEIVSLPEICNDENEFYSSQQGLIPLAEIVEASEINSEKRLGMNIWSRRGKSEGVKIRTSKSKAVCTSVHMSARVRSLLDEDRVNKSMVKDQCGAIPHKDEENFTTNKENASPDSCLVRSLGKKFDQALKSESVSDEEGFTSDKENMTPNSHLLKSIKNVGSSQEVGHPNLHKPSPLKIDSRCILQELKSASKSHCVFKAAKREPFLPLTVVSSGDDKSTPTPPVRECTDREGRCVDYSKASGNRWIIVVDTGCLLNKKSRRELQLLRGLRGTSLVIPRIVLRELDCMVRRASFLSRMTEASVALQWIEESMASTTWWIHVQSSAEESRFVPPTPPAAASACWLSKEKGAFSVSSVPFSPNTLQEIVTPTAADHILESALFFKQAMDGQLVLLSDDVTLKIKAMAEGVICETTREFRTSLVNPFSARFLYSDSSPRGPTWTCVDDTVLKEKYYPSPTKKATRSGDGAKGLKLILLHNSNFRQM